jgi:hypothetical protein
MNQKAVSIVTSFKEEERVSLKTGKITSRTILNEEGLLQATDAAYMMARWHGLSQNESNRLKSALEVACRNLFERGNRKPCKLYWGVSEKLLDIFIYQQGALAEANYDSTDLDLQLIRQIVDEVFLYDDGNRRELHLRKRVLL